ncbi:MAG TPA: hypothetical protein VGC72_04640 [Candidatus Elarobacter sp.]
MAKIGAMIANMRKHPCMALELSMASAAWTRPTHFEQDSRMLLKKFHRCIRGEYASFRDLHGVIIPPAVYTKPAIAPAALPTIGYELRTNGAVGRAGAGFRMIFGRYGFMRILAEAGGR